MENIVGVNQVRQKKEKKSPLEIFGHAVGITSNILGGAQGVKGLFPASAPVGK